MSVLKQVINFSNEFSTFATEFIAMIIRGNNPSFEESLYLRPEMVFFRFLQEWLEKTQRSTYAIVVGSYALHTLLCLCGSCQHEFLPNDMDIFLNLLDPFAVFHILNEFFRIHDAFKCIGTTYNSSYTRGRQSIKSMIRGILEFGNQTEDGTKAIQIIIWQNTSARTEIDLAKRVVQSFDISVCRVARQEQRA